MIHFLHGRIEIKEPNRVILNISNVGMECAISLHTYDKLPSEGSVCHLLTYLHVREDVLQLYGFSEEKERSMFHKLISLSGIGPKQAINILSGIRYDRLMEYILKGDVASVKQAPGVGEKTARRIILELKEKISDDEVSEISGIPADSPLSSNINDAILALESLGYKKSQVQALLSKHIKPGETLGTEEIIRRFLSFQNKSQAT
ncbi:MAG: Holliday junction branch migration protein RuvA [Candidatus Marinimicrobia bacterium]|nr:Holliday junction branch migration protein RuvA [Candidatus Neomarinimicrobiota bacterium]